MIVRLEATVTKGTVEKDDLIDMVENDEDIIEIEESESGNLFTLKWNNIYIEDEDDARIMSSWADFLRSPAIRSLRVVRIDEYSKEDVVASRGG